MLYQLSHPTILIQFSSSSLGLLRQTLNYYKPLKDQTYKYKYKAFAKPVLKYAFDWLIDCFKSS